MTNVIPMQGQPLSRKKVESGQDAVQSFPVVSFLLSMFTAHHVSCVLFLLKIIQQNDNGMPIAHACGTLSRLFANYVSQVLWRSGLCGLSLAFYDVLLRHNKNKVPNLPLAANNAGGWVLLILRCRETTLFVTKTGFRKIQFGLMWLRREDTMSISLDTGNEVAGCSAEIIFPTELRQPDWLSAHGASVTVELLVEWLLIARELMQ